MLDLNQWQLLHEDGPCLVVFKPAGLLTQAPPGIDNLELRVKRFLQQREGKAHNLYLALVHRLDRPVSGALVMARHVRAAQRLSSQFEQRTVRKTYWAIVSGHVGQSGGAEGTWVDWLRKVPGEARSEVVESSQPEGQEAILHYRVLSHGWHQEAPYSWLEIELETGRTHQIRLQCSHHGHPLWGDELYGSRWTFGPASDDQRARWIGLHARLLEFRHPMHTQPVSITAPLPAAWQAFVPLS
ncbi:MAG: RluA family pseudouridine synthase [Planctomycetota bacterium]